MKAGKKTIQSCLSAGPVGKGKPGARSAIGRRSSGAVGKPTRVEDPCILAHLGDEVCSQNLESDRRYLINLSGRVCQMAEGQNVMSEHIHKLN